MVSLRYFADFEQVFVLLGSFSFVCVFCRRSSYQQPDVSEGFHEIVPVNIQLLKFRNEDHEKLFYSFLP